eukprot:CAMPEP_0180434428 /NCGR_PEP_ID=MMETSP1036_2-20121128/9949_1 /TAXON_ID=632150 /ORGANISM="Azadinium spinosum, Strain 3D9" /LENGTH=45 /DNA_ID= /DNA_START= /DNA_END= /DNA_ORIENTATION=
MSTMPMKKTQSRMESTRTPFASLPRRPPMIRELETWGSCDAAFEE